LSTLLVVFHKQEDDQAQTLNPLLEGSGALPNSEERVSGLPCPDGLLVVCYDDKPTPEDESRIAGLVGSTPFDHKILLRHRTSTGHHAAQAKLVLPSRVLAGAQAFYYSHVQGDVLYDGLLRVLREVKLVDFPALVEGARKETLSQRLSVLKHKIAHLFLPMDISLQTAEEIQLENPREAEDIMQRARESLGEKRLEAQKVLAEIRGIIPPERQQAADVFLQRATEDPPALVALQSQAFHDWLVRIDTALNDLRETLSR